MLMQVFRRRTMSPSCRHDSFSTVNTNAEDSWLEQQYRLTLSGATDYPDDDRI